MILQVSGPQGHHGPLVCNFAFKDGRHLLFPQNSTEHENDNFLMILAMSCFKII